MSERFPTLRQSRLAVFDSCALRASFEEQYRRDWSSHPAARGQILHRVYARALKTMHEQNERKIPTDVIMELLFDELRQHGSELSNIPLSQVKDMRWEAVKFANDSEFDIANLVDVEHRLSATLSYYDENGVPVERELTGQLDAAFLAGEDDEEMVVIDYKSSWDMPAPTDLGFDGYFQQRFYAWLVMRNYPAIERVTLREYYTRYSQFREATVYRGDVDYIEQELSALAERFDRAFATSEFPPSPGRQCTLCPRPTACPIFPDVRQEGLITDAETARRVAGEAMVAKAAVKQREAALKAWSSVHGPTPISSTAGRERVWGFKERKRVSRPTKDEMEQALNAHGSRVDLGSLYKESTQTRFEPHHPMPIEDTADDARLLSALDESVKNQREEAA